MLAIFAAIALVSAKSAVATLKEDISNPLGKGVSGTVTLEQTEKAKIKIHAVITGLVPGSTHGWHIHGKPVSGQNCTLAASHFNPTNQTHGGPGMAIRHVGDLGNMIANEKGEINHTQEDELVSLFGKDSVLGFGIVLHEKIDDLGQGNSTASLATGNSGSRLACGNIAEVDEVKTEYVGAKETSAAPAPYVAKPTYVAYAPKPSENASGYYGVASSAESLIASGFLFALASLL